MGELALQTDMNMAELNAILGINNTPATSSARLPELKISSKRKDASGNDIKNFQGNFYVRGAEKEVYAPKVKIRVLSQLFQWIDFDDQNMTVRNKTLLIPFLNMEPRDQKGTVRCGKPTSKEMLDWPNDRKAKYKSITLYRQLRCLVSYTGKTASGEEVVVENQPCIIMNKNSSYMAFEDDVIKKLNGRNYSDVWVECSTSEHENGSVVFYKWHYTPDLLNPVPMDQDTYDTMVHFAQLVQKENQRIDAAYEASIRGTQYDGEALDALEDALDDLDSDFDE